MHIRRGDKVTAKEAGSHSLEEYMEWVDLWYAVKEAREVEIDWLKFETSKNPKPQSFGKKRIDRENIRRRVYIASDDRTVFDEAIKTYD